MFIDFSRDSNLYLQLRTANYHSKASPFAGSRKKVFMLMSNGEEVEMQHPR